MKTTPLILLILLASFASADFEEFPEQFFVNNEFKGKIVVGEDAPPTDVTSAVKIIPALQAFTEDRIRGSILDSDVDDYIFEANNLISLGNPCDNEITAKIMGVSTGCSSYFKAGEGYLYFYTSELNKTRVIIGGGTAADTAKAALVLGNYQEYQPWGTALIVKGTEQPYTLIETTLPGVVPEEPPEPEPELEQDPGPEEPPAPTLYDEPTRADELQKELEEERKEIEDRGAAEGPEDEEEIEGSVHVKIWAKFKEWFGWFFR